MSAMYQKYHQDDHTAPAGVPPEKQFSGKAASEYAKRLAEDRAPKPQHPRKG